MGGKDCLSIFILLMAGEGSMYPRLELSRAVQRLLLPFPQDKLMMQQIITTYNMIVWLKKTVSDFGTRRPNILHCPLSSSADEFVLLLSLNIFIFESNN